MKHIALQPNNMSILIRHLLFLLLSITLFSCTTRPTVPENEMVKEAERGQAITEAPLSDGKSIPSHYLLGPGDELSIKVWRHEDLTRNLVIDPSGHIQFPLLGEVNVAGLTLPECNKKISDHLLRYIKSPTVDISLLSIKNLNVYILGEVSKPGSYEWRSGMPIWDGIAKAGGFTANANEEKLLLVSSRNDKILISTVNFHDIFQSTSSPQNFLLQNGDLIYVLPTTIADVQTFMNRITNIISPIINIESGILLYHEVIDVLDDDSSSGTIIVPR